MRRAFPGGILAAAPWALFCRGEGYRSAGGAGGEDYAGPRAPAAGRDGAAADGPGGGDEGEAEAESESEAESEPGPWEPDAAAIYDPAHPPRVDLEFAREDWWFVLQEFWPDDPLSCPWEALAPGEGAGLYAPARLILTDQETGRRAVVEDAGVRYRGHHADEDLRELALEIRLDAFDADRRPFGLCALELYGEEDTDATRMIQCVAHGVMRGLGAAAPRCNMVPLFINGERVSVFASLEIPDNRCFLANRLGGPGGGFYRCDADCADTCSLDDRGDSPGAYATEYQPIPDTVRGDLATDVIPALRCLREADSLAFRTCIEPHLRVDLWLRTAAAELGISSRDSMAGDGDNFHLYRDPERGLVPIPHDQDEAFAARDLGLWAAAPALVRRLLDAYPVNYCARLRELVEPGEGPLSDEGFAAIFDPLYQVAEAEMQEDTLVDPEVWREAARDWPERRVPARRAQVQAQLDVGCP